MFRIKGAIGARTRRSAVMAGIVLAASLFSGAAMAQAGNADAGQRVWREVINCKDCHGWSGDGNGDNAQMEGANLRLSGLDAEMAREIIRCGIPGTQMPSFRNNAWSQIIPCYGMTEPMGDGMHPNQGQTTLADRNIDALVAYLVRDVLGKGPVTLEYCEAYFGQGSTRCADYPRAETPEGAGAVERKEPDVH